MNKKLLEENITDIISIARLAPSVHNSQAWRVSVNEKGLSLSLNPDRLLKLGDPTGRQAYISLGIFTEACVISLNAFGFQVKQTVAVKDDLVTIEADDIGSAPKKMMNDVDVKALTTRFTDRSIYRPVGISKTHISKIQSSWGTSGVTVRATDSREIIDKTASLTRQGILLAFTNPAFRKELARYLVSSNKIPYGIPLAALKISKLKTLLVKRAVSSGVSRQMEADLEYRRWKSASMVIFILAKGDSREYWIESGRAYLRACLEVEKMGFRQATSAAIVEASDFHEDLEKALGVEERIQCVIRIGASRSKKVYSGRFEPKTFIT